MKKLFAILSAICFAATAACLSAFAADRIVPPIGVNNSNRVGSMLGSGSLAMIVSLVALAVSIVSICLTISYHKKKSAPDAEKAEQDEDDA